MSRPIQVLFLAANPDHTVPLRLDREIRAMAAVLREAEHRQRFELRQESAVEYGDLQGALLRNRPQVVHFSGHGGSEEGMILETAARHAVPVTGAEASPSPGGRRSRSCSRSSRRATPRCVAWSSTPASQPSRPAPSRATSAASWG